MTRGKSKNPRSLAEVDAMIRSLKKLRADVLVIERQIESERKARLEARAEPNPNGSVYRFKIPVMPKKHKLDQDVCDWVADHWNSAEMIVFVSDNTWQVKSLEAVAKNLHVFIDVETRLKEFSDAQVESVRKWISGQCSDGWGEDLQMGDVFVDVWSSNRDVVFVEKLK